ncbi:MAG: DUF4199 domain-containing protein [Chitinophagales bacterium]
MEKKKSAFNVALKYSIITALATFIFSLIVYLMNLYTNSWINWISYIILLAGLIFTVKDRRDKDLGGFISFGEAFGSGFLFCIITGVFSVILTMIMINFIAPDMIDQILKVAEQNMVNKGMSDDQVQLAMSMTKKFMTPAWMAVWVLIGTAFFGCILSLIVAAIFKKNSPNLLPPQP